MVVEKFIVEAGVKVNTPEIKRAVGAVDKLKAASRQLEDEQKKNAKTTLALRERLLDLKTQLTVGKLSQDEYKKAVRNVRVRMAEEGIEARRTADALRVLKTATKEAAAATREHERAETASARALEKNARAADAASRSRTREAEQRGRRQANIDARAEAAAKRRGRGTGRGFTVARGVASNLISQGVSGAVGGVVGGATNAVQESFSQAVGFEEKMADVSKVVDGLKNKAGEAQPAYHKLADELKYMSTQIAVAPTGLADMAAAAGAAGIKGGELTAFVQDAAKTMVAFDISSEEAGNALAKLRANLGIGQDEVRGLAGTMNELSNSMASTAAEVLDATLRVGAVGKAAGLSGQEVAGLSSAMIAAGATSEIAATATKNLILSMSAGAAATRRQREAFSALGMNAEDVAKQFTGTVEQRMAVTRKMIEQMGKLSADKRAATSMQLFGRESLGPIASLTTNLKNYDEAMRIAMDSTAAAGSVDKEFAVRSSTTANAVQLLKNQFSVLAIEVGEGMMPAVREIIAEMGKLLGASQEAGHGIGETLGNGLRRAWAALKEFIGPVDELPGKIEGVITTIMGFVSGIMKLIEMVTTLVEVIGPANTAIVGIGIAAAGLAGPFGLAAAAGIAAGAAIVSAFTGAEVALQELHNKADAIRRKEAQDELGRKQKELAADNDEIKKHGNRMNRQVALEEAHVAKLVAGGMSETAARTKVQTMSQAVQGQNRFLGGGTADDRLDKWGQLVAGLDAGGGGEVDKEGRFAALASKKRSGKPLRQSELAELKALTKELDKPTVTKAGKGKKHKAETAYEGELEGEVQRLSKESGKRAGIKAASEGKSRKEQFAAAKAAEEATTRQLHGRVDAGMSLPGNFMHDQLQRAGFNEVANRGTPPPIAVTIIDVKPMAVDLKFTGPVTADPKQLREFMRAVWREDIPQALAQGIREARLGPIY